MFSIEFGPHERPDSVVRPASEVVVAGAPGAIHSVDFLDNVRKQWFIRLRTGQRKRDKVEKCNETSSHGKGF